MDTVVSTSNNTNIELAIDEILADYRLACESRQASLMGRKEVFMGKAKFGVFGDGKEVAQIAMAKAFRKGDWRSGYYRDQTFMLAIGELTLQQYFAQLYAHTDVEADPSSAGRQMNSHFATRMLDDNGNWKKLVEENNSASDISPTAAQIPRLLGFAYASKLYRQNKDLHQFREFSVMGNEVAFGMIGNASTSEGMFLEAINAAGVLQVPMLTAVWDDGYGISVPNSYHTTKESISKALEGFRRTENEAGIEIYVVNGWDYPQLVEVFQDAANLCRREHVPALVHVTELTQPQGHSTSGSHERYKSKERLEWEMEWDCNRKMREWILENGWASPQELDGIEQEAVVTVRKAKNAAWREFRASIEEEQLEAQTLLDAASQEYTVIANVAKELRETLNPIRMDGVRAVKKALRYLRDSNSPLRNSMIGWLEKVSERNQERFNSHLHSQSEYAALRIKEIKAEIHAEDKPVDGREVLQACFEAAFRRDPRIFAFGEDVGKIGDVNQAFAGLQEKFGELRVTDTGIREVTIIGQGTGTAMRGLRPIAEIQYLDYLVYALMTLTDDLASLHYRTKGGQKAPLIIRTRGHRLEGIWHSGSPMGMILHSLRGIYLLVPRNMTQAAGFYNTLFRSDDPAIIVECLNAYRQKERIPRNIGEFTVPLGVPEVLREGNHITIVTYGAMCKIVMEAASQLQEFGISCEVIDVQTLLPFDVNHSIVESLKKTNRIIFADEDVPGGASAFMMQQVLEEQGGYNYLDSPPVTIAAQAHRPAYSSDGDYFSKPNVENIFDAAYQLMHEADPANFPSIY